MFKNFTANHGKTTIHDEDVMNESTKNLLESNGLNEEQITSVGQIGIETEEDLSFLQEKDLTDVGVPIIKARKLLKQVQPKSPENDGNHQLAEAIKHVGDAVSNKNTITCPFCGKQTDKDNVICGECGLNVKEEVRCLKCGHVSTGGKFCTKCRSPLVAEEDVDAVSYIMKEDSCSVQTAKNQLEDLKQGDPNDYARFKQMVKDSKKSQPTVTRGGDQGSKTSGNFCFSISRG